MNKDKFIEKLMKITESSKETKVKWKLMENDKTTTSYGLEARNGRNVIISQVYEPVFDGLREVSVTKKSYIAELVDDKGITLCTIYDKDLGRSSVDLCKLYRQAQENAHDIEVELDDFFNEDDN